MIEKYEHQIEKNHEIINLIFEQSTAELDLIPIESVNYIKICKSGIRKFDGVKIYLDTSSVDNTNINDESYRVTFSDRPSRANMQPIANTVWFAKLKDSPKYILIKKQSRLIDNFIFSTGFLGLKSENELINYIYALILSKPFNDQKNNLSNGATMQGINNQTFSKIEIPNIDKQKAYYIGKELSIYVDTIISLKEKVYKLKSIKNNLLSKYFD